MPSSFALDNSYSLFDDASAFGKTRGYPAHPHSSLDYSPSQQHLTDLDASCFSPPMVPRSVTARPQNDAFFARDLYGVVDFLDVDHDVAAAQHQKELKLQQLKHQQLLIDEQRRMQMQKVRAIQQQRDESAFFESINNAPRATRFSSSFDDDFTAPSVSRNNSFDYPGSPVSPSSTSYSVPSSRNNSVDMDANTFSANMYLHQQQQQLQQLRRQMDTPRYTRDRVYDDQPMSPREPSPSVSVAPSPLQSTGGGTAALTPQLAVALTAAQIQLSQRKKQRDSLPPPGYCCRLCAIEGHWMENCILYKSNKHPQYNNAARAVALNIISPSSQQVLNSLPVVAQPTQLFTPKFYQEHQQKIQQQDLYRHQQQPRYRSYESTSSSPVSVGSPGSTSRFEQIWAQN
ncbi:hypothetical protein BCR33DRAFT_711100 [Rhizoclosmatium globosum]|uniref:Uncharacterized protein n=1 Tax=Rhizoclosmatium globosum TaxID=329046 RepID=A0A1Y2D374_9FUNG|nr:hypothetical protein BCR33DRAFT_711100 [Rhizoclosmatium globosum]|eukprot:ORY53741.1 hypothetical protein BCR33DRAFT_711100 [Rhizoclosmatium globosum]